MPPIKPAISEQGKITLTGEINQEYQITSPNGKIKASIYTVKELSFTIELNGNRIIESAVIALDLGNGKILGKNPKLKKKKTSNFNEEIQPVVPYKDAKIQNHYNELQLHFKDNYQVVFRAYDDGVAYRFIDENKKTSIVKNEVMEFVLPSKSKTWFPKEESM